MDMCLGNRWEYMKVEARRKVLLPLLSRLLCGGQGLHRGLLANLNNLSFHSRICANVLLVVLVGA